MFRTVTAVRVAAARRLRAVAQVAWVAWVAQYARVAILAAVASGLLAESPRALAMSAAGVTMPDTMQVADQHLQLNGMGIRSFTVLHIRGYVAGLYVPAPSHDPDVLLAQPGIKVLRLEFVRTAGVGRVRDEYQRGHRLNCVPACSQAEEAGFAQLLGSVRPVQQGDTTTFIFRPDRLEVQFDDRTILTIAGAEFGHHLLASFLGPQPPTPALRDGLLGHAPT